MTEDGGIWATWYDLPEERKAEYLSWLHGEHIPAALERPGYLWAAHYRTLTGSRTKGSGESYKTFVDDPSLGNGGDFLLLFGAESAHAFLDPSPAQLLEGYDPHSREMVALRAGMRTGIYTEVGRVDGPEVSQRGPGLTPAPMIQMGAYRSKTEDFDLELAIWYVQNRLAALTEMPGVVGARKLLALGGWARHSILYEFVSPEAREHYHQLQEAPGADPSHPTGGIVRALVHGPDSPTLGTRIWPEVK